MYHRDGTFLKVTVRHRYCTILSCHNVMSWLDTGGILLWRGGLGNWYNAFDRQGRIPECWSSQIVCSRNLSFNDQRNRLEWIGYCIFHHFPIIIIHYANTSILSLACTVSETKQRHKRLQPHKLEHVWSLQLRWLATRGWAILCPGQGRCNASKTGKCQWFGMPSQLQKIKLFERGEGIYMAFTWHLHSVQIPHLPVAVFEIWNLIKPSPDSYFFKTSVLIAKLHWPRLHLGIYWPSRLYGWRQTRTSACTGPQSVVPFHHFSSTRMLITTFLSYHFRPAVHSSKEAVQEKSFSSNSKFVFISKLHLIERRNGRYSYTPGGAAKPWQDYITWLKQQRIGPVFIDLSGRSDGTEVVGWTGSATWWLGVNRSSNR